MRRAITIAALVVLVSAVGVTTHGWLDTKSQLTRESQMVTHESQKVNALKTLNARAQERLLTATADLQQELKIETQIAQAEAAIANEPITFTTTPTTTTTLAPETPYEECWASGQWVGNFCAGLPGAPG
jgi:hypothetical protein